MIKIVHIFIFTFLLLNSSISQSKIDPILIAKAGSVRNLEYIVLLDQQVDLSGAEQLRGKSKKARFVYHQLLSVTKAKQKKLENYLRLNKVKYKPYLIVNAFYVESNAGIMGEIASFPEVKSIINNFNISVERVVIENGVSRNPSPEWGIKKIQADSVWNLGYNGQNVVVGGQDTGYDWKVGPLKSKYRGFINDSTAIHSYNWHDAIKSKSPLSLDSLNPCGFNIKVPCDDNNHGTHTMGTMVGGDSLNTIGVAPGAKWMACRNMERGNGQLSTYLECFEWFLAPTDTAGMNPDVDKAPHVINNSWYCSADEGCNLSNWDALQTAVANLKASGVVVVISAGNSGPSCSTINSPPALFGPSFTVGSMMENDTISGFSSRGPVAVDGSFRMKPDICAPGSNVRSVIRGGNFANFSGTSMAGPHVAGAVALIISANPTLSGEVAIIENILTQSVNPKFSDQECDGISGQQLPNPIYGYGRTNALKAVELALNTVINTTDDLDERHWSIYPNPVEDKIYISQNSETKQHYDVKIFDTQSRLIFHLETIERIAEIDMTTFKNNVYFVSINDGKKIFTQKIFKL